MALLGFGSSNPQQQQMYSLLGVDPATMRRQALMNGLAQAGFTLMGNTNLGAAGGAFLQGTNQGRDDYMQNALLGYKMKTAAEDRAFNRQWQQDERNYQRGRDKIGDARQVKADAWMNTQNQHTLDQWQQAEDLRQGQQNAVQSFDQNFTRQGGNLFSPQMQGILRQNGISGVDPADTQRYNKMQPYVQAGAYPEAFQQMTAAPEYRAPIKAGPGDVFLDPTTLQPMASVPSTPPQPTGDIQEYNFAVQQGYKGSFQQYQTDLKRAGATTIDNRQMGTIPPGYKANYDGQGNIVSLTPIPGSPAAAEVANAANSASAASDAKDVATDTILNAASQARNYSQAWDGSGLVGKGMSYIPYTNAAQTYGYVDTLKAQATVQNLNAMRKASPTGGALGAVSEKENKMLADMAGRLDPASPTFPYDLDQYTKTLLQTVHGREYGTKLYNEWKASNGDTSGPLAPNSLKQKYGLE